jgi:hypothetical protein
LIYFRGANQSPARLTRKVRSLSRTATCSKSPHLFSASSPSLPSLVSLIPSLIIATEVAVSLVLSAPKDILLHATRTTKIVLLPSKCAPSSSVAFPPWIVAVGYITLVIASLVFILHRAASIRNGVNSRPPTPLPKERPKLERGQWPREEMPWIFWLLAIFISFIISTMVGFYIFVANRETRASISSFIFLWIPSLLKFENFLSDEWIHAASLCSTVKLYASHRRPTIYQNDLARPRKPFYRSPCYCRLPTLARSRIKFG